MWMLVHKPMTYPKNVHICTSADLSVSNVVDKPSENALDASSPLYKYTVKKVFITIYDMTKSNQLEQNVISFRPSAKSLQLEVMDLNGQPAVQISNLIAILNNNIVEDISKWIECAR